MRLFVYVGYLTSQSSQGRVVILLNGILSSLKVRTWFFCGNELELGSGEFWFFYLYPSIVHHIDVELVVMNRHTSLVRQSLGISNVLSRRVCVNSATPSYSVSWRHSHLPSRLLQRVSPMMRSGHCRVC